MNGQRVQFYMPARTMIRLRKMAENLNVSMSELVTESVEERLRALEQFFQYAEEKEALKNGEEDS